jgi:hypothetical protein
LQKIKDFNPKEDNLVEVVAFDEPLMSADQSPISIIQNDEQRTIQDFSPVELEIGRKI